jgi:hypothetical protein
MPERNAHVAAFFRLPLARKTGVATAIPSGMLWRATATMTGIPRAGSFSAIKNVAMPSGKL